MVLPTNEKKRGNNVCNQASRPQFSSQFETLIKCVSGAQRQAGHQFDATHCEKLSPPQRYVTGSTGAAGSGRPVSIQLRVWGMKDL